MSILQDKHGNTNNKLLMSEHDQLEPVVDLNINYEGGPHIPINLRIDTTGWGVISNDLLRIDTSGQPPYQKKGDFY